MGHNLAIAVLSSPLILVYPLNEAIEKETPYERIGGYVILYSVEGAGQFTDFFFLNL